MKNISKICLKIIIYIIIAIGVLFAATLIWLMRTWIQLSYAELVYHLSTSISGTNKDMVVRAIVKYAVPAVVVIAAIIVGNEVIYRKTKRPILICGVLLAVLSADCLIGKEFDDRTNIISDVVGSILKTNESDFIENNYVDAGDVQIEFPENKRNLIYIYLESTEISCADKENGGAFDENVIPNLTDLSEVNENFSGTEQNDILNGAITLPGTDWTMGGMFAQSTGLPLKIALSGNTFGYGTSESFFPQITSIGDILEDNGYKNVLLLGSDATFGGRSLFYETHGDYDIHDFYYAKEVGWIPQDYYVFWGFEDYKLFMFAKEDLLELAADGEPFNYTMLTVDTHFEDGYFCDLCEEDFGDNQYANVFACADRQVAEFVNWIKQQDFYENTTIIICGDHTTMDSDFYSDIDSDYQRKTYTCIINGVAQKDIDTYREYATIDMFPTTLAALGAEVSSDRLGIGTNLFSSNQTIIEQYGLDFCTQELQKNAPFLEDMAGLSINEDVLEGMKDSIYLETANYADIIRFRVFKLATSLNYSSIKGLLLTVENTKTNETKLYNMELIKDENSEDFYAEIYSDIPYEELNDLDCKLYISVGDYNNYLLQDFTSDMFEEWDIRWDSN